MGEFVEGFETLASLGPAVTIFGSARVKPESEYYELAERTAALLAEQGFAATRVDDATGLSGDNVGTAEELTRLAALVLADPQLAGHHGNGEGHHRCGDAVVETALHVQALSDARRDALVGDHRLTQRGVGAREDDRQHQRLGQAQARDDGDLGPGDVANTRSWTQFRKLMKG